MSERHYRSCKEVAAQLGISPSTLRAWTKRFAAFLSPDAANPPPRRRRRYTDEDMAVLMSIKSLRKQGFNYEQIAYRLEMLAKGEKEQALIEAAASPSPAVTFLADALHSVASGQQLLLTSQQASRELLGVVLQDNFNLKEENARLRDRMLRLERDLFELRRESEARRIALEERLRKLEEQTLQARTGCLGRLFGLFLL